MTAELYIHKALLQFSRRQDERAVESLYTSLDLSSNDLVSATQAHCILGEYFFIHQQYQKAKEHLLWILERAEKLEQNYDDLLNSEVNEAGVLIELIEKFSLC